MMFFARLLVDIVTGQTGHLRFSESYHVANVFENVPIGGIERLQMRLRPIDLKIAEQVITRNKVVGIG